MKDRIIDCLAYDGKVSIKCISSTNLVEEARKDAYEKVELVNFQGKYYRKDIGIAK